MTNDAGKRVCLEPSTEQTLRIQLAYSRWERNLEARGRLDAERRFFQLAFEVTQATLPYIDEERTNLEHESRELAMAIVSLMETVKLENAWGDEVNWDAATLTFTAPAKSAPGQINRDENNIRIQ